LIIDLKGNASPNEISRTVDEMHLTRFNRLMTKMVFKTMLLKRAYTKEQFRAMLLQAPFASVDVVESGVRLEVSMTR
jgi:hypothetical protein